MRIRRAHDAHSDCRLQFGGILVFQQAVLRGRMERRHARQATAKPKAASSALPVRGFPHAFTNGIIVVNTVDA